MTYSLKCLFVAVFILVSVGSSLQAQDIKIEGLRFGKTADATRFVLDVSGQINPRVFMLSNPNRIVIDVPNANWGTKKNVKVSGLVAGYRHGLFSSDVYRIVLDLKSAATVKNRFALPASGRRSNRYVIDLKPATSAQFVKAVADTRKIRISNRETRAPVIEPRKKNGKRVIVLDPGHGGPDPGTLGRSGANEKTITLKIAKEIKARLEATGRYKVYLTRTRDIFVRHRRRFALAKSVDADLFISVHVDAIDNKKVRGGTVYTLNERASDKEAARLAAKENRSEILAGVDLAETTDEVSNILIELAQRETLNNSARFAEILVPEMRGQVRMHKRGHRFANFLVLKSPDVPSVLIETGYITNREDARMLSSKEGQRRISKAINIAVDKYFDTLLALGR
ncbi:MAG: N-acetylmuramoyl-L-alanine amidase [Kordiimonadales bacterium]|nr:MAG: N-acetylmuramoyl-L-alanine amidase [Kordiimonadales bacterium]